MNELLTLPWQLTDDSSPIASRMAAWAAREIIERRFEPGELLTEADLAEAQTKILQSKYIICARMN